MVPKIERLPFEVSIIGEGPHWDVERQTLYYIDVQGSFLLRYTPSTNKFGKVSVAPKRASFIIPVAGKKDQFVVGWMKEIAIISWDGESDIFSVIEIICAIDGGPNKIFNDAKCDLFGSLWVGSVEIDLKDVMNTPPSGILYSLNAKRELKEHIQNIKISNGLTFNHKSNKFYFIDSLKGTVDKFSFHPQNGVIEIREEHFTLQEHDIVGLADGMTVDADGNLWVAVFNSGRVIKIDGEKPETLLQTIDLPASQVTSVIWGGRNLDELYVTTASIELEGKKPPQPENGSLYKIMNLGVKGLPGVNFTFK